MRVFQVIVRGFCQPLATVVTGMNYLLNRPATILGNQAASLLPSGFCTPYQPGTFVAGQCWQNAYRMNDVVLYNNNTRAQIYKSTAAANLTGYILHGINTTVACETVLRVFVQSVYVRACVWVGGCGRACGRTDGLASDGRGHLDPLDVDSSQHLYLWVQTWPF